MPRWDADLQRSAIVYGVFLVALTLVLFGLYGTQIEGDILDGALLAALLPPICLTIWLGRSGASRFIEKIVAPVRCYGFRAVWVVIGLAVIVALAVAYYALDTFPNSGDEFAYVMQAETYAQGHLWADAPPLPEAFDQDRFFVVNGKWVSQYAPGWALVLMPAAWLGLPLWIVTPLLGAAMLGAFFLLARHYVSLEAAWIGLLLLGVSPFFLFNAGSYFPHVITALYGLAFALAGTRYIARGGIWSAIAAGVCLGFMGVTRTQNAAIFAIPFAAVLAATPSRRAGLFWFGLGGAPFLVALLAFNDAVTGNPLLAVQNWREAEPVSTPSLRSVLLSLRHMLRLNHWTAPPLAFGYVAAFVTVLRRRGMDFCDWIAPLTVTVLLFYTGTGGNQYGPRYYFEVWPFALLTILKAADPMLFGTKRSAYADLIASALTISLLFELGYIPARWEREHRVVMERQDVYAQAERAGLNNAIVVIADKVGRIRPMDSQDLNRDGLRVNERKVLYVLDLGASNAKLRAQFPGRSFYVYSGGRLTPLP